MNDAQKTSKKVMGYTALGIIFLTLFIGINFINIKKRAEEHKGPSLPLLPYNMQTEATYGPAKKELFKEFLNPVQREQKTTHQKETDPLLSSYIAMVILILLLSSRTFTMLEEEAQTKREKIREVLKTSGMHLGIGLIEIGLCTGYLLREATIVPFQLERMHMMLLTSLFFITSILVLFIGLISIQKEKCKQS